MLNLLARSRLLRCARILSRWWMWSFERLITSRHDASWAGSCVKFENAQTKFFIRFLGTKIVSFELLSSVVSGKFSGTSRSGSGIMALSSNCAKKSTSDPELASSLLLTMKVYFLPLGSASSWNLNLLFLSSSMICRA